MATQVPSLSPALLSVLIEQAAQGNVKSHALIGVVDANTPLTYKDHSAVFTKTRPGEYIITMHQNGNEIGKSFVNSPVEAKLEVLDFVISMAKEQPQKAA